MKLINACLVFSLFFLFYGCYSSRLYGLDEFRLESASSEISLMTMRGNTNLTNFHLGSGVNMRLVYMDLDANCSADLSKTSEKISVEKYNLNVQGSKKKLSWLSRYNSLDWFKDIIAGVENRYMLETGLIFHIYSSKQNTIWSNFGFSYSYEERVSEDVKQSPNAKNSYSYALKLDNIEFNQTVCGTFDLYDRKNFDISSDSSVLFRINKILGIKNTYTMEYENEPTRGYKNTNHKIFMSVIFDWR